MRVREGGVGRLRRETWKALVFRAVNEVSQRAKDAASAKDDSNKSHRDGGLKCSASKLDKDARSSRAAVRALQRLEQRERHAVFWMLLVKALFITPLAYAKEMRLCLASASAVDS
jgi:hypothetical protein